jgi:hypothetical protein
LLTERLSLHHEWPCLLCGCHLRDPRFSVSLTNLWTLMRRTGLLILLTGLLQQHQLLRPRTIPLPTQTLLLDLHSRRHGLPNFPSRRRRPRHIISRH